MDVFRRFKELADMKKEVTDADLEALVADEAAQKPEDYYRLVDIQVVCGTMGLPTATVKMENQHGEEVIVAAGRDGSCGRILPRSRRDYRRAEHTAGIQCAQRNRGHRPPWAK